MKILWKANDGKSRPKLGIPEKGTVYEVIDSIGKSYVKQNLASEIKRKPTVKPKKAEE